MLKKCICLILSAVLTMTLVVQVWADADAEVSVTSGTVVVDNITADDTDDNPGNDKDKGADVEADGGSSSLNVGNDIEVVSSSDDNDPDTADTGVEVSAENHGSAAVTVGGSVDVVSGGSDKAIGVDADTDNSGTITFSAGGIDATSQSGLAIGINADAEGGSSESFNIGGDGITASGTGAKGIDIDASEGSSVNVNVVGNIVIENKNNGTDSNGIELDASGSGTEISARVAGDVKGSGMDSSVEIKTENGAKVDVVAEGTLSAGKGAAVAFAGSPDNVSLIIWKAEAGTDGSIVKEVIDNNGTLEKTTDAETLESSIHYIIRVDTSQSIDLGNTTEMSYTAPDGSVINYNTAKEGERVAVKLNVPSGYVLKGVFSDEARQCSLQKEGGEYYLIVPKGGGVFVNMWLEAKSDSSENDGSAKEPAGKESGGKKKDKDHETTYEGSEGNPVTAPNEAGSYTMGITEKKPEMSMTGSNLLNISFPAGTDRFTLNLADIQQYIEAGMRQFVINTPYGSVMIPVDNLLPYLQAGNPVTFILNNGSIEVLVNGSVKLQSKLQSKLLYDQSLYFEPGEVQLALPQHTLQAEAEPIQWVAEQPQTQLQQAQLPPPQLLSQFAEAFHLRRAALEQQGPQPAAEQLQTLQGVAEALQPAEAEAGVEVQLAMPQAQQFVAELPPPQLLSQFAEAFHLQRAALEPQTQQLQVAEQQQTQQAEAEAGVEVQQTTEPQTQQAVAEAFQQAAEPRLYLQAVQYSQAGVNVQEATEQLPAVELQAPQAEAEDFGVQQSEAETGALQLTTEQI